MAKAPTYRIVKRRDPPKRVKKYYDCPACHGTVHAKGHQTLEAVREVHESTCPAALRLGPKGRA